MRNSIFNRNTKFNIQQRRNDKTNTRKSCYFDTLFAL